MYDFLSAAQDDEKYRYCMVGYKVENTLTENGTVSRGVCTADEAGFLASIIERTAIQRGTDGVIRYEEKDSSGGVIPDGTPVSMNLWGFTPSFLGELTAMLRSFFAEKLPPESGKGRILSACRRGCAYSGGQGDCAPADDRCTLVRRDLPRGQAGCAGCACRHDRSRRVSR